jgi:hypothetical protein
MACPRPRPAPDAGEDKPSPLRRSISPGMMENHFTVLCSFPFLVRTKIPSRAIHTPEQVKRLYFASKLTILGVRPGSPRISILWRTVIVRIHWWFGSTDKRLFKAILRSSRTGRPIMALFDLHRKYSCYISPTMPPLLVKARFIYRMRYSFVA